ALAGLLIFIFISRGSLVLGEGSLSAFFKNLNAYYLAPLATMIITFTAGLFMSSKKNLINKN
ncbi:MAG: hypothetical protein NE327_15530, partial [Lentisphaeraceae bacterium]|nr:hypothetical protein [Lentisphaeraceae bacterium]